MSEFSLKILYLLFLWIALDFRTIYYAFEQQLMIKGKLCKLKSLKNQLLITGVKIKLMVPN
jgi:hypothetical protein